MTRHALREVTQRQMINIVAARRRKGQDEETGDDESKYQGNQTALVKSSLSSEQKKETHCNSKVFCNLDECLSRALFLRNFKSGECDCSNREGIQCYIM